LSPLLHIVCLDVPYPADYGGAIDMLYKIQALHDEGVKIHLHYFSYNHRGTPNELNRYCETIHAYERETGRKGFSFSLPHIVASRINPELIKNLQQDNYPVLLEGLHCTGIVKEINKNNRKIIVRLHNDEYAYYKQLAKSESNLFRKIYFLNESRLLKNYEKHLPVDIHYLCITDADTTIFKKKYGLPNVSHLAAFAPFTHINNPDGVGNFCLYHGNLSVSENEKAAAWLVTKVFSKIKIPLVIAGKNPSKKIESLAHFYRHTCLIANPTDNELHDLIQKAQINVLPSFNNTGIKLKLINVLFNGRHCLANDAMVAGTGLEQACHIANTPEAMASVITQLYHQPFTEEETVLRKKLLTHSFDNTQNAKLIIQWIQ
jgi:glycosyltransferase involved in cell wall biosynthesis